MYNDEYGRVLVIPDIHGNIKLVRETLLKWSPTKVILLGDLFDGQYSTKTNVKQIVRWLCQSISNGRVIPLLGNHDLHYLYDFPWFRSEGYRESTKKYILKELQNQGKTIYDLRKLFKLFYVHVSEKPYYSKKKVTVMSHAGIQPYHLSWVKGFPDLDKMYSWNIESYYEAFGRMEAHFRFMVSMGLRHPLTFVGPSRGGTDRFSGPLWLNWSTFNPVPNIDQIVGHTTMDTWAVKHGLNSSNYCIDTVDNNYVIMFSNRGNEPDFTLRNLETHQILTRVQTGQ